MTRPRLLAVSNHPVYPPHNGFSLRVANLLPELARDWSVALVAPPDPEAGPALPPGAVSELATVPASGPFAMADPTALRAAVDRMLATWRPDVVLAWCGAEFAAIDHARSVPVVGDRIDCMTLTLWRDWVSAHGVRAHVEALRGTVWHARYERRILRALDATVVVGESDAQVLQRLAPAAHVHVVPNGVAVRGAPDAAAEAPEPTVAFTGVLSHPPNAEAARWFAQAVWPLVRAAVPGARYVIAGREPDAAMRALGGRDGIEVHADVPDMHALLSRAWVAVAPMQSGAGIKNKVLEAWAAGKPVVMTSMAANGLHLDGDGSALVQDDTRAMAEQVVRLLRDDAERRRTGARLHARVRDAHSWRAAGSQLSELLEHVRRGRRSGAA